MPYDKVDQYIKIPYREIMKASNFAILPIERKKEILKSAARGANEDQLKLLKHYKTLAKKNGAAHNGRS